MSPAVGEQGMWGAVGWWGGVHEGWELKAEAACSRLGEEQFCPASCSVNFIFWGTSQGGENLT